MIVVLVMDRQLAKILRGKFASAPGTNPRVELERLLPIALIPLLLVATGLRNDLVQLVGVWACTFQWHSRTIPLSPAGTSLTLVCDGFVHDAYPPGNPRAGDWNGTIRLPLNPLVKGSKHIACTWPI